MIEEQKPIEAPTAKKELTEDQKFARTINQFKSADGKVHGVNDRQLSSILRRQKRKLHEKSPRLNELFAIVLSTVFDTTIKSKDGLVGTTLR
jgi:hypothetical protein